MLLREPTVDETIEILHGLKDSYEAFHRVRISDEAIAGLNIPTGIPLLYELDDDFKPITPGGEYLDPEAAKEAAAAVANQGR